MDVAIDVGGTNVRIAASPSAAQPNLEDISKFSVTNDYTRDIEALIRKIEDLTCGASISGIGCCFPGPINEAQTSIAAAPNLSDWVGRPLVDDLRKAFNCRVELENDAACAALGEAVYGAGKSQDFVFLIWGTGFGGAAVIQTSSGVKVQPMEPGHIILEWEHGRLCGCGQTGCAEAHLGGANIARYLGKTANALSAEEWLPLEEMMAHALMTIVAVRPVPLIVFGGGVAINQRDRIAAIGNVVRRRLRIFPPPIIQITDHGDNTGLIGGFALLTR